MFRVRMGVPILTAAQIPFKLAETCALPAPAGPLLKFPLKTHRGDLPVTVTSMGNPHCSVFVADYETVDWLRLGQEIEQNEHFPNRTNVEFVRLVSKDEIEVRFWERGVGHTLSSGTGSCAAVVAAILHGLTDRRVRVHTEAGILEVCWPQEGEISLTGPAAKIMQGTYLYAGPKQS
jgi:diaminopimelate epimerase